MIYWYTDNELSQLVGKAITSKNTVRSKHIKDFCPIIDDQHIFYGIHRGCGNAMHSLIHAGLDYFYVDNGYFGAKYIDKNGRKKIDGTYRIVKNAMHEKYVGPMMMKDIDVSNILVLPPSPYSAYFNNTTVEDWTAKITDDFSSYNIFVKNKGDGDIKDAVSKVDAVIAFNSIGILEGIAQGKPVYDTHGVLQNYAVKRPHQFYYYDDLVDFYADKQFTLEQIAAGEVKWDKIGYS